MIRTTTLAMAALVAGLGFATPALSQGQGGTTANQGGPHGSDPGPIAPQLQAIQQSLLNAERQLSQSQGTNQPPNYDQTRRALMGGQDTLAEMRNAGGGRDNALLQDAERQVSEALRMLESPNPDHGRVVNQVRQAANAITTLGSATGATTGGTPAPGQPAMGGGQRQ